MRGGRHPHFPCMAHTVLDAASSRFPGYGARAHNVLERPGLIVIPVALGVA